MSNLKRKHRRFLKKQQFKINAKIKKRLFSDIVISPCCYCRYVFLVQDLTIEHLVPRCHGGTNEDHNISLACAPCNHKKGREAWFQKKFLNKLTYQHLIFK